ncbi:MAG TPA: putative metal-dependent hydrolase [Bacteroidota bacterium]|nr:putative metal-dependent hydrolase [Bacteroidota bacterium]
MSDLRYPIGKFQPKEHIDDAARQEAIRHIAETPSNLKAAIKGLTEQQINTPYRDGGWTIRQVVHHLPDSHLNSYVRMRLALTENEPTIKPYEERLWAELYDAKNAPVAPSVQMLESLHERWVMLLRSLGPTDFSRTFRHPENGVRNIDWLLQLYSWHGRHHVAHITSLRERMKW